MKLSILIALVKVRRAMPYRCKKICCSEFDIPTIPPTFHD